jgi:hypothetical protein
METMSSEGGHKRPIRRVVTGLDDDGRSAVISDGPATRSVTWDPAPDAPAGVAILWGHDDVPRLADGYGDAAVSVETFFPPLPGATRFFVERFDPGYGTDPGKSAAMRDAFARARIKISMAVDGESGFHATATVDYGVVLSGRIQLVTDRDEVTLEAGDVIVQNGVVHAWRNVFDEVCEIAFVLVGARNG